MQSEDMDAINVYMRSTKIDPSNAEAFRIKDDFIKWWDSNIRDNWYNKAISGESYDIARTRRNQFQIANAKPGAEREGVRRVITTGIETEVTEGGVRPPVDAETGRVGSQVKKPTVPATPSTAPKSGQPQVPAVVGNAPVPLNRILMLGVTDSGKGDVKAWQTFLGILPPTGNFGTTTAQKTSDWQKKMGLKPDGKVGPATWAKAFPGGSVAPSGSEFAPPPVNPRAEDLFAPTPKPATPASPKPSAPKPAPSTPQAPKTAKEKVADAGKRTAATVKQAGILDVGSWPLWAKVGGILTIVAAAAAAATGKAKVYRPFATR